MAQYCPLCGTPTIKRPDGGRERDACPSCDWIQYAATGIGDMPALVNNHMGFWIFIDDVGSDSNLQVVGYEPSGASISVDAGWNLIGWASMDGGHTVQNLIDANGAVNVLSVEAFDSGNAPYFMTPMGAADTFTLGQAYWVKVEFDGMLALP